MKDTQAVSFLSNRNLIGYNIFPFSSNITDISFGNVIDDWQSSDGIQQNGHSVSFFFLYENSRMSD